MSKKGNEKGKSNGGNSQRNTFDRAADWKDALANKRAANVAHKKEKLRKKEMRAAEFSATLKEYIDSKQYIDKFIGKRVLFVTENEKFPIEMKKGTFCGINMPVLVYTKDGKGNVELFAYKTGLWRFRVTDDNEIFMYDVRDYMEHRRIYIKYGEWPEQLKFYSSTEWLHYIDSLDKKEKRSAM